MLYILGTEETTTTESSTTTSENPTAVENPTTSNENPITTIESPTISVENPTITSESPITSSENPTSTEMHTTTAESPTTAIRNPTEENPSTAESPSAHVPTSETETDTSVASMSNDSTPEVTDTPVTDTGSTASNNPDVSTQSSSEQSTDGPSDSPVTSTKEPTTTTAAPDDGANDLAFLAIPGVVIAVGLVIGVVYAVVNSTKPGVAGYSAGRYYSSGYQGLSNRAALYYNDNYEYLNPATVYSDPSLKTNRGYQSRSSKTSRSRPQSYSGYSMSGNKGPYVTRGVYSYGNGVYGNSSRVYEGYLQPRAYVVTGI